MSQENVESYRRLAKAFESRKLDAFLTFFDPDADFAPRSAAVHGGSPFHGHEGIRDWWESMFSVFSDYVAEIDEVRDLGSVTFGRARLRGQGMGSGVPMEQAQWHVVEWRDGLIINWRTFPSEAEALTAAGMSK
ncbi:MAG TPA: nuclear transport factor 2 family protein [Solirubrobacterales bacterium]|nr:nuclear transport factor 2 family protein [Solirubrobacterales bacterium]